MEMPSDDDQDGEEQDLKRCATKVLDPDLSSEGNLSCDSDTSRLTYFSSGIFVLCLENSGKCQSDDNNMVFNVVDSILVSPDCVNTI